MYLNQVTVSPLATTVVMVAAQMTSVFGCSPNDLLINEVGNFFPQGPVYSRPVKGRACREGLPRPDVWRRNGRNRREAAERRRKIRQ